MGGVASSAGLRAIVQAFKEANNLGATKKGTVLSWLAGNFNKDYDFVKDLDADTEALQKFMKVYNAQDPTKKDKGAAFNATLKDSSVVLQDFVKNADDGKISVENFFSSVTGASKLITAIKGIGLQMLTTAAQAAAIWAITEGVRLFVNWLDELSRAGEIAREKMRAGLSLPRPPTPWMPPCARWSCTAASRKWPTRR